MQVKEKVAAGMGLKVLAFKLKRIEAPLVQRFADINRASSAWRVRMFGREGVCAVLSCADHFIFGLSAMPRCVQYCLESDIWTIKSSFFLTSYKGDDPKPNGVCERSKWGVSIFQHSTVWENDDQGHHVWIKIGCLYPCSQET